MRVMNNRIFVSCARNVDFIEIFLDCNTFLFVWLSNLKWRAGCCDSCHASPTNILHMISVVLRVCIEKPFHYYINYINDKTEYDIR